MGMSVGAALGSVDVSSSVGAKDSHGSVKLGQTPATSSKHKFSTTVCLHGPAVPAMHAVHGRN